VRRPSRWSVQAKLTAALQPANAGVDRLQRFQRLIRDRPSDHVRTPADSAGAADPRV
jgi:hypothetical protein